jgi:hypothetical protein
MRQSAIVNPSEPNTAIATGSLTEIPGMVIRTLNGSGWVKLSYSIRIYNSGGSSIGAHFQLSRDDLLIPLTYRSFPVMSNARNSPSSRHIFIPGPGLHTYKLLAFASGAGVIIEGQEANLILEEPGY